MRRGLVADNRVVQIVEAGEEFEVAPPMFWADCEDHVEEGFVLDTDGSLVDPRMLMDEEEILVLRCAVADGEFRRQAATVPYTFPDGFTGEIQTTNEDIANLYALAETARALKEQGVTDARPELLFRDAANQDHELTPDQAIALVLTAAQARVSTKRQAMAVKDQLRAVVRNGRGNARQRIQQLIDTDIRGLLRRPGST